MKDALIKLLKIKSLVTILLTLTFAAGAVLQMVKGYEIPEALINIYMVIIGFYFGTQLEKKDAPDGPSDEIIEKE